MNKRLLAPVVGILVFLGAWELLVRAEHLPDWSRLPNALGEPRLLPPLVQRFFNRR